MDILGLMVIIPPLPLYAAAFGADAIAVGALITRRASSEETGKVLGVSSALRSAANAITPLMGGTIFQFLGSTAPFLMGGMAMVGLAYWSTRAIRPGPEEQVNVSQPVAA